MGCKRTAAELLAWPSQSESEGFAMLGVAAGRHAPTTVAELQERLRAKVRGAGVWRVARCRRGRAVLRRV